MVRHLHYFVISLDHYGGAVLQNYGIIRGLPRQVGTLRTFGSSCRGVVGWSLKGLAIGRRLKAGRVLRGLGTRGRLGGLEVGRKLRGLVQRRRW